MVEKIGVQPAVMVLQSADTRPDPQGLSMQVTDNVPPIWTRQTWPDGQVVAVLTPWQVTVPQVPVETTHLPERHEAWVRPAPGQLS